MRRRETEIWNIDQSVRIAATQSAIVPSQMVLMRE